jgi:hypothetical protein
MENKSPEYLWGQLDDLFHALLTESYNLKLAARNAVDKIQELENNPDFGVAWDAQVILLEALNLCKPTSKEGWDV